MTQIRQGVVAVRTGQQNRDDGRRLFFLFSARQVEEVLGSVVLRPVPFAPSFLLGMARWRGHLLPVVDLEKCLLGAQHNREEKPRFLVLRSGATDGQGRGQVLRCILRFSGQIQPMDISDTAPVLESDALGLDTSLVRGIYDWEDGTYIVPDFVSILRGR